MITTGSATMPTLRRHTAFTLVELAVALAMVTICLALLVVAARGTRTGAQSAVSLGNVRLLSEGQLRFAQDNDGYIAGPNSTGLPAASLLRIDDELLFGRILLLGDQTPTTPTTTFDWISPILGDELGLSTNRAERYWQIMELLACPRATRMNDFLFGTAEDLSDFEAIFEERGYRQVSYLAPASFLGLPAVPGGVDWDYPLPKEVFVPRLFEPFPTPFRLPSDYRPRLDRIDNAGNKVCVAGGTRYYLGHEGLLDFDVNPAPVLYSSFASSGPTFEGSIAYGRKDGPVPDESVESNIRLSCRYPGYGFHAGRWDGSAYGLTAFEAWADPVPWHPTGSIYAGSAGTPEIEAAFEAGDVLP